jgi:hypothetical protein
MVARGDQKGSQAGLQPSIATLLSLSKKQPAEERAQHDLQWLGPKASVAAILHANQISSEAG